MTMCLEMIFQLVTELPDVPVLKEMVDWFNAIRAARFHYLQVAFPGAPNSDVSLHITHTHAHKSTNIQSCNYS